MGVFISAFSIIAGCLLGDAFKNYIKIKSFSIFGISIMIISMVSFYENIFNLGEMGLKSDKLLLVVFSLIVGTVIGDMLNIESKFIALLHSKNDENIAVMDATLFFGIGGLQICGPVLLAATGDSSQLILKSIIDFPFALMFGMSYGKKTSLSAIPVALGQIVIVFVSKLFVGFFTADVIKQICAIGYIILFFSGFNLICESKNKINNFSMIIGIFIILIYNIVLNAWRCL